MVNDLVNKMQEEDEKQEYILVIEETIYRLDYDGYDEFVDNRTYRVSTRKIAEFCIDHSYEYGYVSGRISNCLVGQEHDEARMKFSFSDNPEWYTALEPDADCTDIEKHMSVKVM